MASKRYEKVSDFDAEIERIQEAKAAFIGRQADELKRVFFPGNVIDRVTSLDKAVIRAMGRMFTENLLDTLIDAAESEVNARAEARRKRTEEKAKNDVDRGGDDAISVAENVPDADKKETENGSENDGEGDKNAAAGDVKNSIESVRLHEEGGAVPHGETGSLQPVRGGKGRIDFAVKPAGNDASALRVREATPRKNQPDVRAENATQRDNGVAKVAKENDRNGTGIAAENGSGGTEKGVEKGNENRVKNATRRDNGAVNIAQTTGPKGPDLSAVYGTDVSEKSAENGAGNVEENAAPWDDKGAKITPNMFLGY